MVILSIIEGDLLESSEKYIAHQCNCITKKGKGLSESIGKKFPYADHYKFRNYKEDIVGTIKIYEGSTNIICLFAQYLPGKPNSKRLGYNSYCDTYLERLVWFEKCLKQLENLKIDRISMPYLIGCGLAGGNWADYQKILENSKLNIVLYKKIE